MTDTVRHPILIGRLWLPLIFLAGGRPSRSYVLVDETHVRFSFGPLFDETMSRRQIAAVRPCSWPFLGGVGWRVGRAGTVGLIGSRENTVEVLLDQPRRVRLCFFPMKCRRIVVSLRDPTALLAELSG